MFKTKYAPTTLFIGIGELKKTFTSLHFLTLNNNHPESAFKQFKDR